MTLVGPLLFAAILIIPAILAATGEEKQVIQVLDESGLFKDKLKPGKNLAYHYVTGNLEALKNGFKKAGADGLVYIPSLETNDPKGFKMFFDKNPGLEIESKITSDIEDELENIRLTKHGIDRKVLDNIRPSISIETKLISEEGKEEDSSSGAATAVGYAAAFLIYFFIFLYGIQVMRGVIEEKSNRIIEVVISSVKPFELMMGKILGIALVGLTQFLLWVALTTAISTIASSAFLPKMDEKALSEKVAANTPGNEKTAKEAEKKVSKITKITNALGTVNLPLVLGCFLFYFIGGYLLYSSLFAAIGAAVDNETDTQQFMMPVTIPLIVSLIVAQVVLAHPESPIAFWMSIIPLTSPIVMMVRIPFNPPAYEIAISMVLLVAGFLGTTWLAARIYRVGILMYGKKVTYRELSRWLFYKV